VAGAGISTLLSRVVSALVILRVMFNDSMPIHLDSPKGQKGYFKFDFDMIRRIFRVGVPNGLENSLFQVGKVLIMGIITTFQLRVAYWKAKVSAIRMVGSFFFLNNTYHII
jgi:Na+-driven multidrug efflux pump